MSTRICVNQNARNIKTDRLCFNHIVNLLNLLPVTTEKKLMGEHWPKTKERKKSSLHFECLGLHSGQSCCKCYRWHHEIYQSEL